MPNANLTKYQARVYCTGVKLFSNLPHIMKNLKYDIEVLKLALKDYLLTPLFLNDFTCDE